MGLQLDIPSALAAFGFHVDLVPGWESRGSATFDPEVVVDHWTAGPRGTLGRPSLNVVTYGRPGLDGPLCNVYLDRFGIPVVVAAGRANHAGAGGWRGFTGNRSAFGIEAESAGNNDWTDLQRAAYPRVNAALLTLTTRKDVALVAGHNEWAPSRKIDIRDWDMPAMRAQTAVALGGTYTPPPVWVPPTAGAPAFPLRDGYYFGPKSGPRESVSGYYQRRANGQKGHDGLALWQQRMADRGWTITVDGLYGGQSAGIARKFQKQCRLKIDALIGRHTFVAPWTAPIT